MDTPCETKPVRTAPAPRLPGTASPLLLVKTHPAREVKPRSANTTPLLRGAGKPADEHNLCRADDISSSPPPSPRPATQTIWATSVCCCNEWRGLWPSPRWRCGTGTAGAARPWHGAALRHAAPASRWIDGAAAEMSPGELGAVLLGMLKVSYHGNTE